MRRSLNVLARLQREETQQRQRMLAKAQREVTIASEALARVRAEMAAEEALAASDIAIASPFYLPRAQARVFELNSRLEHLQREQELARASLLESYQREKLNEKHIEKRKKQESLKEAEQEQKESALLAESSHHNKSCNNPYRQ